MTPVMGCAAPLTPLTDYDLPTELWFRIIAFVLSDGIYTVCCSPSNIQISWEKQVFGTLRLVSRLFNGITVKVAELALSSISYQLGRAAQVSALEEDPPPMDADKVEIQNDDDQKKLKSLYDRFNLINAVRSNRAPDNFLTTESISLLSAYYCYIQLINNCKRLFSTGASLGPANQTQLIKKFQDIFPIAFRNILTMLDWAVVPEMVERLRRDVMKDWQFITTGMQIVHKLSQATQRPEWQEPPSEDFYEYLQDLYEDMQENAEWYNAALKERVQGEFPTVSELPGVRGAVAFIVRHGIHHRELTVLVTSWV